MSRTENERQPLKEVGVNRKRLHSQMSSGSVEESRKTTSKSAEAYEIDQGALTPPHSFVHRSSTSESRTPNDKAIKTNPLSPELSSPIKPQRAKKMKSDQGRSSGMNTVEEFLEHLSDESRVAALQDPNRKPPYSYAMMIVLSILQSDTGKLTLSQIYYWISSHFPYYKPKDAGWQNSIRHNLSLNEAFVKGGKSLDGKGHFWEIKPGYESRFLKNEENFSIEDFKMKLRRFKNISLEDSDDSLAVCSSTKSSSSNSSSNSTSSKSKRKGKGSSTSVENDKSNNFGDCCDTSVDQISDCEDDRNSLINIPSSPRQSHFSNSEKDGHYTRQYQTIDKDYPYYEEESIMKRQGSAHLGTSLKFHTRAANMYNHEYDDLMAATMSSPKFKKYTCSFNTSFEPASPMTKLQLPMSQIAQSNIKTPVRDFSSTPLKFNILATPKDCNRELINPLTSTKAWQSPSRLFEDYYASPVFFKNVVAHSIDDRMKQYETEKICIESPRKLSLKGQQSYGVSNPAELIDHSKYSSNALFGVDVCSVWKRVIAHCNNDELVEENESKDTLAPPFDGMS